MAGRVSAVCPMERWQCNIAVCGESYDIRYCWTKRAAAFRNSPDIGFPAAFSKHCIIIIIIIIMKNGSFGGIAFYEIWSDFHFS
jgi:hypothetical protein